MKIIFHNFSRVFIEVNKTSSFGSGSHTSVSIEPIYKMQASQPTITYSELTIETIEQ